MSKFALPSIWYRTFTWYQKHRYAKNWYIYNYMTEIQENSLNTKPLQVDLLMHICITQPQFDKRCGAHSILSRMFPFYQPPSFTLSRSLFRVHSTIDETSLITMFMWPTWGPSGTDRTQVGPMLVSWTLLSGMVTNSLFVKWYQNRLVMALDFPN